MSREWKPGDVALAPHPIRDGAEIRGIIDTDGRFYTTDQSVLGISSSCFALDNLRPLVVIDPEDAEQVERLARGWWEVEAADLDNAEAMTVRALRMRAALREFANLTPPKPEEPTGLGAGVEQVAVTLRGKDFGHVGVTLRPRSSGIAERVEVFVRDERKGKR